MFLKTPICVNAHHHSTLGFIRGVLFLVNVDKLMGGD
jgi:hypothetical protein